MNGVLICVCVCVSWAIILKKNQSEDEPLFKAIGAKKFVGMRESEFSEFGM